LPYISTIVPDSQGGFSVNVQPRHSTEYFSYNIDSLNNWSVNIDSDPIGFTQNGPNLIWVSPNDPNVSLIINDTKPETPDGSVGSINGFEHAVLSNGNIAVTWYAGINKTNSFGTEKVEDVYTRVLDPVSGTFVSEEINLSNSDYTDDQSDLINMQFNLPYISTIVPDSQGGFSVNVQPRHSTEYFSYNILDDKATFTASIDKWHLGDHTSSTWLDGPSMKLHRKDIQDEVGIDLMDKDDTPGHKHKPDMNKGEYELRVEHDQQTDGAIDIDDVMGVLSLSRGKSSPASKEHKLAADWNGDGIIDIDDVMGVLARSRGKSKEDEWRFHDKTSDTSLWDNATKTNKMDITLEENDDIDLTAILRGDVNGSYNANEHNRADPSPAPTPNYAPLPVNNDDELLTINPDIV